MKNDDMGGTTIKFCPGAKDTLLLHGMKILLSQEQWSKIDCSRDEMLGVLGFSPLFIKKKERKIRHGPGVFFHLRMQWSNVP